MNTRIKTIKDIDYFYDGKGNIYCFAVEYDTYSNAIIGINFSARRTKPNLKDCLTRPQASKSVRGKTERLLSAIRRETELFPNKNYDSLEDTRSVKKFLKQYCSKI